MAADSGMDFYQRIIPPSSSYNRHMVSFQSGSLNNESTGMVSGSMTDAIGSCVNSSMFSSQNPGIIPLMSTSQSTGRKHIPGSLPIYNFVTGSPSEWSSEELAILREGLVRYAQEPNFMKYVKVAALLPSRTTRDVALRCCWKAGNESGKRRKSEDFSTGRKSRDFKVQEKLVAPRQGVHIQKVPSNTMVSFSLLSYPNPSFQISREVHVLDDASQRLLEENNLLLDQISANIETLKLQDNGDLFVHASNNIKTILTRMSEMSGIMCRMPPLPVSIDDECLHSLLQLKRMDASYGTPGVISHLKQEAGC